MFIRSLAVTGFVVIVAMSVGKDAAALHQEMASRLDRLQTKSAVQFECSVQNQIVERGAQIVEHFPDGSFSYTVPGQMAVDASGATSPLVMKGSRLTDDQQVVKRGKNDVKVSRAGKLYLAQQTMTPPDGSKVVTHYFSDGNSRKGLVEKFTSEGVQRSGSDPARPGPSLFVPQYSRVYELADPANFGSSQITEVSESTVKLLMIDDNGPVEYLVDTNLGVITQVMMQDNDKIIERTYSDFVSVGDFHLPGNFTEKEKDSEGNLLREMTASNCKYKLLSPEEVEATLKLDMPEGTEMSQRGLSMPVPGF